MNDKSTEIAKINDAFRIKGAFSVTQGIFSLPSLRDLTEAVMTYCVFNEDNDPYGEHDFGSIDWFGNKVFWKIDYYDSAFELWADPLSSECHRVLTVMLADEY